MNPKINKLGRKSQQLIEEKQAENYSHITCRYIITTTSTPAAYGTGSNLLNPAPAPSSHGAKSR